MAKTKFNFRLSDDACMSLTRLSGLWGCDRTAVVERALAEADPSAMDLEERESTQASMEQKPAAPLTKGTPFVSKPADPGGIAAIPGTGSIKRSVPLEYPSYAKRGSEVSPVPKGKK